MGNPMYFLEDDPEPGSELSVKRRADDPAIHKLEHAGHFAHHSPPRIPGTGIDADDGDGENNSRQAPRNGRKQAAEDNPNDIRDSRHRLPLFSAIDACQSIIPNQQPETGQTTL